MQSHAYHPYCQAYETACHAYRKLTGHDKKVRPRYKHGDLVKIEPLCLSMPVGDARCNHMVLTNNKPMRMSKDWYVDILR